MENVTMKEIPDFPNYYITTDGRVWSGWRKKFIAIVVTPKGYHRVVLSKKINPITF